MGKAGLIEIEDAALAVRRGNGRLRLRRSLSPTVASAVSGAFWGLLIGGLFLSPLTGMAAGAVVGALACARSARGIGDGLLRRLAEALPPGAAALLLLVTRMAEDQVVAQLRRHGGAVLRSRLDPHRPDGEPADQAQALRDALRDVAGR